MKFSVPRGTQDILPAEIGLWHFVEEKARKIFELYNYRELRTPIFESTDLFTQSIGSNTDIVSKEMYTFQDKKGRSLTLRPEGTASIVRSFLENTELQQEALTKLWYQGPMFRYERPQAGRYRQFYQMGCEILGAKSAYYDAEIIALAQHLFELIGLQDLEVNINSVGCKVCRPVIKEKLKSFLGDNLDHLCGDCKARFDKNPLRILDCKNPQCNTHFACLPDMSDVLCADCREHFHDVKNYLNIMRINFKVNPRLVRGLDYYTKTVFEVISGQLGAQNAVCGGGHYDNLVQLLGGPALPAVGFAFGMERIVMIMQNQKIKVQEKNPFLYLVPLGENAKNRATILANKLRRQNIPLEIDSSDRGLSAKLKTADKQKANYVFIIGEEELVKKQGQLRNMQTGKQQKLSFDNFIKVIEKEFKKKR